MSESKNDFGCNEGMIMRATTSMGTISHVLLCVMCYMLCVMCDVLCVMCYAFIFMFMFIFIFIFIFISANVYKAGNGE